MLGMYPAFAMLVATDLERARAFYEEVLGLEPIQSPNGVAIFSAGEGTTVVLTEKKTGLATACAVVGFTVRGLDTILEELKLKGVEQMIKDLPPGANSEGIIQGEAMRTALIKDSEGNTIVLNEMIY